MAEHVITPAEYRYYVADLLTNNVLSEIGFTSVSYERALSKSGSFTGTIPVIDSTSHLNLYENTMPGKTALYVLRDGVCVWGGIIWGRQYSPANKTLQVDGSEFTSYLYHRFVWQTLYYGSESYYCKQYKADGSTATIYTDVSHGFSVGETIRIRSLNPAINGDHTITSTPSSASFTFATAATLALSPSTTGLARTIVDTYDMVRDLLGYLKEDFSNLEFVNDEIKPSDDLEYSISNKEMTAGLATLTTTVPHDLISGQQIQMVDVDNLIDGYQIITATPASDIFTVDVGGSSNIASTALGGISTYNITSATIETTSLIITTKAISNNIVTLTTSATHGLSVGDYISISNVENTISVSKVGTTGVSGEKTVVVPNNTDIIVGMMAFGTGIGSSATVQSISGTTITLGIANVGTVSGTVSFAYQAIINGSYYVSSVPTTTTFTYEKSSPNVAAVSISKADEVTSFSITNSGSTAYLYNSNKNPTLYLIRGNTYTFNISAVGHNFWIQTTSGGYSSGNVYSSGVTGNGTANGSIIFTVPSNAPSTLYYQSQQDSVMSGRLTIYSYGQVSYKSCILTTSTPHGLSTGKSFIVSDVGADYDGTFAVSSVPNSTSLKYNSLSLLNRATEAVYGGTLKWGPRAVAGTYGAYSGNSDTDIQVSEDLSGKYIGVSQQIFRGSDMRSFGDILEEFSKDLNGFEYRIDCDFQSGSFVRTFSFVPFIDPPNKIAVVNKALTSNVGTITTESAHGLSVGDEIVITDVGLYFNGTREILSTPTTTTFTFSSYASNVSATACSGYIGIVHPLSVLGADQFVFEYPGNVLQFNLTENAENSATRMWVVGATDNLDNTASAPYAASTSTDLLDLGWPLIDQVDSKTDNVTVAYGESALYSYARDFAGEARPPEGSFSITINGSIGPYVGDFLPGDWCSIIIDDDFVRMRLASDLEPRGDIIVRKIIGYKVSVPDSPSFPESVTLELISEWKEDRRISTLKTTG